ncbi:MAG: PSD1 and planctomycete cytochrome C domain-containing protein [Gemmata sp.]|nr:PSD1 and planctomycete cytochrome C domain-containing protein [Gemmata sp.]
MRWLVTLSNVLLVALSPTHAADSPAQSELSEFFEKKIRPLFAEHCYSCHGPQKQNAGLRLDTAAGIKAGADDGPVIVPGEPAKSRLIRSVRREGDYAMPPKKPLPPEAIELLTTWVKNGAVVPADTPPRSTTDPRQHWAFQPPREPIIPATEQRHPIDALIVAKLKDKGLTPAPRADKHTLIRRAYLDLIGLPPTYDEVQAFVHDESPQAWEKLIDRLLASPHYGERWGRYWLDVARYADTKGYVFQEDRNFISAYTYRDYVIRSFNEDTPYNRFIIEQLAADLLPLGDDKRPLAALGFLTLGRRFLNNQHDIIDDRIDVVTRGFMGLTVACARCHDHKYDPVPIQDYYSLYGVFASCHEPRELPIIENLKPTPEVLAYQDELQRRERELQAEIAKRHAVNLRQLAEAHVVAQYIQAVVQLRGKPDNDVQNTLRQLELNRFVYDRWKNFLEGEWKRKSPVYSLLLTLSDIPENEFADKLQTTIPAATNSVIRQALEHDRPANFSAAVQVIAKVLTTARSSDNSPDTDHNPLVAVWKSGGPLDIPEAEAEKLFNRDDRNVVNALRKRLDEFKAKNPYTPPRAHVLYDNAQPIQPVVFLRGNPGNRGPQVPRQAPAIIAPNRKPFTQGSGRLELAHTIASPDNPLTARVIVNRVWLGHFGHGLVRTPSDFGVRCEPPTHPELLDWLALQFIRDGWSLKKLHKRIMLSETYQQSSVTTAEAFRIDPDNRLLARQNRRRLDFEALRDSILAVAGRLDTTLGGQPVDLFKTPFPTRRTVYGLIDRTNLPGIFRVFDVASPDTHSPQRFQTTVPQQALFLLNSPFILEQANALAQRKEVSTATTPADKVTALYRLALSRNPTNEELALALEFVRDDDGKNKFGRWPQLAQVLLLSNEFAFAD